MVTGRSQMGDSHSNESRVPFSASETKTELLGPSKPRLKILEKK